MSYKSIVIFLLIAFTFCTENRITEPRPGIKLPTDFNVSAFREKSLENQIRFINQLSGASCIAFLESYLPGMKMHGPVNTELQFEGDGNLIVDIWDVGKPYSARWKVANSQLHFYFDKPELELSDFEKDIFNGYPALYDSCRAEQRKPNQRMLIITLFYKDEEVLSLY